MKQIELQLYPEHEKLKAIPKNERDAVGEFIEWLSGNYGYLVTYGEREAPILVEQLMAEYYEIDLDKLEEEKVLMLEHLRMHNEKRG